VIFQRSLIREFSLIAIAVVGVLLAIILTRLLILLLGKAAGGEVLPEAVIGLIAFGILTYMPVLLGIAVFVAVLLALTRSYRDSEMTVWFTSGLSIAAWVRRCCNSRFPWRSCARCSRSWSPRGRRRRASSTSACSRAATTSRA
jgi:lipopolysaccharide export system permease protein